MSKNWWSLLCYTLAKRRADYLNSIGKGGQPPTTPSEIWKYRSNMLRLNRLRKRITNFWTEPL